MTETAQTSRPRHRDRELWLQRGCALIVAGVAAYGSYQHQRDFALHGGADPVSAARWPLSVDGLLLLATVGLLKSGHQASRRARLVIWLSFCWVPRCPSRRISPPRPPWPGSRYWSPA